MNILKNYELISKVNTMDNKDLPKLRKEIEKLDIELFSLIFERVGLAKKIGRVKFENNIEIKDLEKLKLLKNQNIFHAGTLKTKNGFISNGGRVLNFVSTSDDFLKCRDETINLIKKLNWKNGYFRRDIGYKVIKI